MVVLTSDAEREAWAPDALDAGALDQDVPPATRDASTRARPGREPPPPRVLCPRLSLGAALIALAIAFTLTSRASRLRAQTLGAPRAPGGAELSEWLTAWSPIGPTADLGRELPGGAAAPFLLTLPAPRTGSFWTAGNPAALPWEVRDAYAQFRLGAREHQGEYRRPLDAGTDTRVGGSALGWTPVGGTGAAVGRVTVDYLNQDDAAHADVTLPYGSNPFVMLDTLGDEVSGIVTRLEGAGGWRLGDLGVGLGLGFDGRQVRTVRSPAPRNYRASASGVTGGLQYDIAADLLRIGVYARWEQTAQSGGVSARNAESRVHVLRGYSNPTTIDLGEATRVYFRRFDRTATAVGASVSGVVQGVAWTVYGQQTGVSEHQSVELENDPPADTWDADGWTGGAAVHSALHGGLFQVTLTARYATLTGDAVRMDLDDAHFHSVEQAWHMAGEVRLSPHRGWAAALRLSTTRESRQRQDSLARLGSDLKAWMPAASAEVARALPGGFTVSVGAGYTGHAPWGSIPDPSVMSEAYRDWIAPELALYGTKAATLTRSATLRWRAGASLDVWARGAKSTLSGTSGAARLPMAPAGSRDRVMLELGITMRAQ